MNITDLIVGFIDELRKEDIPHGVIAEIKECLLDYLGVTYAGAYAEKEKLNNLVKLMCDGEKSSFAIGFVENLSISDAALINGLSSHYFELDDGSRFGMVHLGTTVFSALIPLIKKYDIGEKNFLIGAIVGYEVALRLAVAIQPSHKEAGFHATGTCGCIGAAAAVAVALDLDSTCIKRVLAAATASSSGFLEMISNKSELKPFNSGKAAQNAIVSLYMGTAGFNGPLDPIGGKRGLVASTGNVFNVSIWNRDVNQKYLIKTIYKKPYASCRHCHSSVEAVLKIKNKKNVDSRNIKSIDILTYKLAIFGHDHSIIDGVGSAKMSIPYSVAAAYVLGEGGLNAISESAVNDSQILELAKKVTVKENEYYSSLVPKKRIAEVHINYIDGSVEEEKVIFPKGEPENPMSYSEVKEKYFQMMTYAGIDKEKQSIILNAVETIDQSYEEFKRLVIGGVLV